MESSDVIFYILVLLFGGIGAFIGGRKSYDVALADPKVTTKKDLVKSVFGGIFIGGMFGIGVLCSFGLLVALINPTK